jgi:hypothetical protein
MREERGLGSEVGDGLLMVGVGAGEFEGRGISLQKGSVVFERIQSRQSGLDVALSLEESSDA